MTSLAVWQISMKCLTSIKCVQVVKAKGRRAASKIIRFGHQNLMDRLIIVGNYGSFTHNVYGEDLWKTYVLA